MFVKKQILFTLSLPILFSVFTFSSNARRGVSHSHKATASTTLGDWTIADHRPNDYHQLLSYIDSYTGARDNYGRKISPYDEIMRSVAEREGLDWRLLSAIAYHESRFMPHAVSHRGARGIMQIMPVVARNFDVPEESIADIETNVLLAARLLNTIEGIMRLPATTDDYDRISLVIACYNAGVGHIADARRLARKYGRNANSWNDVQRFLRLKSRPEYYCDDVVRSGAFTGARQTSAFVRNVLDSYDDYCLSACIIRPEA